MYLLFFVQITFLNKNDVHLKYFAQLLSTSLKYEEILKCISIMTMRDFNREHQHRITELYVGPKTLNDLCAASVSGPIPGLPISPCTTHTCTFQYGR